MFTFAMLRLMLIRLEKYAPLLLAALLILAPGSGLANEVEIVAMTENNAPFNYKEDGKVVGIFTDLLLEITRIADVPLKREDIRYWPWARSYSALRHEDNVILYATARTEARDSLFQWVGPVVLLEYKVLARKDRDITINRLEDIQRYSIATIRDSAADHAFSAMGVPLPHLYRVNDMTFCMKMLEEGRVDAIAFNAYAMTRLAKRMDIDMDKYEFVHTLFTVPMYYAISKEMPAELVSKMQLAFEQLKADGTVDEIFRRYE